MKVKEYFLGAYLRPVGGGGESGEEERKGELHCVCRGGVVSEKCLIELSLSRSDLTCFESICRVLIMKIRIPERARYRFIFK